MSGEARILQPDQLVNAPGIEKQPIAEQKNVAANEPRNVPATVDSTKPENRFARLKRHLRKRSASIL